MRYLGEPNVPSLEPDPFDNGEIFMYSPTSIAQPILAPGGLVSVDDASSFDDAAGTVGSTGAPVYFSQSEVIPATAATLWKPVANRTTEAYSVGAGAVAATVESPHAKTGHPALWWVIAAIVAYVVWK